MERFLKQYDELKYFFNREPKRILIGREDFEKLMGQSYKNNFMQFGFNVEYVLGKNEKRYIYGLEVQVIPWMSGMLIMPD